MGYAGAGREEGSGGCSMSGEMRLVDADVRAYIAEVDDRTWGLCQWRLAENTDLVPERMVIDPGAVPCALVEWEDKRVDL